MQVEEIRSYETVLPSIFLIFKMQLQNAGFSIAITLVLLVNISIPFLSTDPCWDWGFTILTPCKFQRRKACPVVFVNRHKERDVGASPEQINIQKKRSYFVIH